MKIAANSFPQDTQLLGILESVIDGKKVELYATQELVSEGHKSLAREVYESNTINDSRSL